MKTKKPFLLPALIAGLNLLSPGQAPAQTFTSLGDTYGPADSPGFLGNTVYAALHGLASSGDLFYGTWGISGPSSGGSVWVVNTDAITDRTHLYSFSSVIGPGYGPRRNADGADPYGGLILSGDTLYGTTTLGGTGGIGTIFKLSTDGTGFTVLRHAGSQAGLLLSGDTLYGTTDRFGDSNSGTVFALNINGTGYTTLHRFPATIYPGNLEPSTNSDGASPAAGLILAGNTLYGTASAGGASGAGTVFAVNRDGTGFQVLHHFTATERHSGINSDGAYPAAELVLLGNTLYGTATGGGSSGNGTVFAVNTDGTGFTNLYSCTETSGAIPQRLTLSGNTLYGITSQGGGSGQGTVFSLSLAAPPTIYDGAFRITNVVLSGGNLTVSFPTVTGRNYTLWRSDTLAGGTWMNAGLSALPGTGATLTFSVPAPAAGVFKRFFRVHADQQP